MVKKCPYIVTLSRGRTVHILCRDSKSFVCSHCCRLFIVLTRFQDIPVVDSETSDISKNAERGGLKYNEIPQANNKAILTIFVL